jgi:PAS domain S-box-containing protein
VAFNHPLSGGAPASAPMRILVVDDDEFDRLAVRRCLQDAGTSVAVDEAASAADALAHVTPDAYDCVLLDYYIPGVDTVSLLRRLHAAAETTPVVILTGRGDEGVAVEVMKAGATDYLPKAMLTADRLATSLRYAVEMSRAAAAERRAQAELSEQETRFRTLANAIPQLAWMTDADGSIYWYNQRWYDYTGTTLEDMRGWGWQQVHHPDHVQRVVDRIRRSFETGEAWEDTFPLRGADGQYRWFLSRAVPMRRTDGSIVGWLGTNTDITEQLETEQALREREAEFRTLANAIPQLAWIADSDGRRYWFNTRWYEYTGLRPDECLGLGWWTVHHPDHRAHVLDGLLAAFKAGAAWEEMVCLRRADGNYRWFLARAMPIKDEDGRVVRWFGTNTDLTERREAERALAASEERFRRALEIETVGITFFNTEGEITAANDAFLRMGGYTREDVDAGRVRWDELTPPEFMPQSLRAVDEFKTTGRTTPYEKQYIRKDGSRWWALFAATRLSEHEGAEFVVDVTARKNAEFERERLLADERAARAQAEHATKARDEVLAVLAHDVRTPMQAIVAAASLLALTADDVKRQRQLAVIQRATASIESLVTELLDMARMESGAFEVRRESVDIVSLIREVVELFAPQAQSCDVSFRVEIDEGLPPVLGDGARLTQVLSNLLGNALKFSAAGGSVVVRALMGEGGVQISVKDSGAGISAEDLPHVFDRFWRATGAKPGAGLGLAICKGVIEAHGGRIWANSKLSRGTTFYVQIPRHSESPAPAETLPSTLRESEGASPKKAQIR